jgi:SPRY domain/Cullin binding
MASREGPSECKVENTDAGNKLRIGGGGTDVNNSGNMFESVKGTVCVRAGKWYFEVKLGSTGNIHIGVCQASCNPGPQTTNSWGSSASGIGNDRVSWSYDGGREKKYHGDTEGERYGEGWSSGDVIGVLIDCDARTLSFYKNGNDLGQAFSSIDVGDGLYPAASFDRRTKAQFNFGKSAFKFNLPEVFPDVRPLHVKLSSSQGKGLVELFDKYKSVGLSMAESGEIAGEDHIKGAGSLELAEDLGAEGDDDPLLMIVSWKLNATTKVWEISRDEWVGGWSVHGCSTIEEMTAMCKRWKGEIDSDDRAFKSFYFFVFDFLKEDRRILPTEEAVIAWTMINMRKHWPLWDLFEKFIGSEDAIQRDTWRMILSFSSQHPNLPSLDNYDEDGCWPSAIDDFVEAAKEGKIEGQASASSKAEDDSSSSSSDSD